MNPLLGECKYQSPSYTAAAYWLRCRSCTGGTGASAADSSLLLLLLATTIVELSTPDILLMQSLLVDIGTSCGGFSFQILF